MDNQLSVFNFNGVTITVILKNNEPWFIGSEVCQVLEIANSGNIFARLKEYEKGIHSMDTLGGEQQKVIISESGLYRLVLKSRKPQAEAFQDWVCQEVLPQIRKSGSYGIQKELDPISVIDGLIEGLKLTKQLQEQLARTQLEVQQLNEFKQTIQDTQEDTLNQFKSLPTATVAAADLTTKAILNRFVRDYALNKTLSFGYVYSWVYREFRDRYHVDLTMRGKNHKPKLSGTEYADRYGFIEQLYAVAQEVLVI